jgi:hypothetical protein
MGNNEFLDGWIGLYRSILTHWIYPKDRIFTKYEAWIDLLLMVNFEEKKVFIGEDIFDCKRGEIITSQLKLMKRWKWSKSKLLKFFSVLENDKMCAIKSDNKKTAINICNYINYQDFKNISKNKKTTKKTVDDTTERLQKDTTKEREERKEYIYSAFYDSEILKSNNDSEYIEIVKCLFGENNLGIQLICVLKMETQLSYEQFQRIKVYKKKYSFSTIQLLEAMENWGNPKKYKTVYGTFQTFLKRHLKTDSL